MDAIERDFGSFEIFRAEMTAKTVGIQGSGWGWLVSIIIPHPSQYSMFFFLWSCGVYYRVMRKVKIDW